jgi:hypothetical protein
VEDFKKRHGFLPGKMYLQFDSAKNNKCNAVLKLLSLLIALGVYRKIKICFLLVGHTHNDVDQVFSVFTKMCEVGLGNLHHPRFARIHSKVAQRYRGGRTH